PTVNKKFPTSNSKVSTADLGNKGKAVKASACWIWKPKQNSTDKASQSTGSQIKFEDINQIDEDDIEEMDIKWNMALLSMRADKF
nr:hypothetical protein [Tanacetum cinerariifolium]